MMLKSKKLLVLFLGVLFVSSGMVFAEMKVGIINPEKVVREHHPWQSGIEET